MKRDERIRKRASQGGWEAIGTIAGSSMLAKATAFQEACC